MLYLEMFLSDIVVDCVVGRSRLSLLAGFVPTRFYMRIPLACSTA